MPCPTQPQAKKKISRSTRKGGAQQDLVVHPRAPAHHQAHAVVLAPSATLGSMPELIDAEVFSSLHTAVGFALVGAVVGEYLGASAGLGYRIAQAEGVFDTVGVFSGM